MPIRHSDGEAADENESVHARQVRGGVYSVEIVLERVVGLGGCGKKFLRQKTLDDEQRR